MERISKRCLEEVFVFLVNKIVLYIKKKKHQNDHSLGIEPSPLASHPLGWRTRDEGRLYSQGCDEKGGCLKIMLDTLCSLQNGVLVLENHLWHLCEFIGHVFEKIGDMRVKTKLKMPLNGDRTLFNIQPNYFEGGGLGLRFLSPRRISPFSRFSRGVIFARARVSLALLSLRKTGDYSYSRLGPFERNNNESCQIDFCLL